MTKDKIKKIQARLNVEVRQLPLLVEDGIWGRLSRNKGMAYQNAKNLYPSGHPEDLYKQLFPMNTPARPIDGPSAAKIQRLHPRIRQMVTDAVNEANAALTGRAQVRITQGLRTMEEQAALYAQGRTKPGKVVTWAKPGSSYHNAGLAIDFALLIDGKEISWSMTQDFDGDKVADWMEVVRVFKARGFEWGGDWSAGKKDYPHFQITYGLSMRIISARIAAKKVDQYGYVLL